MTGFSGRLTDDYGRFPAPWQHLLPFQPSAQRLSGSVQQRQTINPNSNLLEKFLSSACAAPLKGRNHSWTKPTLKTFIYMICLLQATCNATAGTEDGPLMGARASLFVEIIKTPEAEPFIISVFEHRIVGEGLKLTSMQAIRGETGLCDHRIAETMVDIYGNAILITLMIDTSGRFRQAEFSGYVFPFPDVDPSLIATARLHRSIRLRMMKDDALTVSDSELRINVAGMSFRDMDRILIEFRTQVLTSDVSGLWP